MAHSAPSASGTPASRSGPRISGSTGPPTIALKQAIGLLLAAAARSIAAGADLILMTGSASWNEVFPALLRRATRDTAFRARVREAAARVRALKKRLGLRLP